jgi:hypothetical protein
VSVGNVVALACDGMVAAQMATAKVNTEFFMASSLSAGAAGARHHARRARGSPERKARRAGSTPRCRDAD